MVSLEAYMDIFTLHRQGQSLRSIARRLGIHRNTVKKYIEEGTPPAYKKTKRRESILAPWHDIIARWLDEDDCQAT